MNTNLIKRLHNFRQEFSYPIKNLSENHHANECGCYRMRENTFDVIKYINTYRILMILVPLESEQKALSNDTKIIKIR